MAAELNIFWFRQDLRLADNPALTAAVGAGAVLPVYILDDESAGQWALGGASRWWLHESLTALDRSLDGRLVVLRGPAAQSIKALVRETGARGVYWNRCYEPWRLRRDQNLERDLTAAGCRAASSNGSLLWEPWQVLKADGRPYKVFTPYYRNGCLKEPEPRKPLPVPDLELAPRPAAPTLTISDLDLVSPLDWPEKLAPHWRIGEQGAQEQLARFMATGLTGYRQHRDFPARPHVSRLSPRLHFGEISPHQIWHAAGGGAAPDEDRTHFCTELGWREFSYYLLYHFPTMPSENLQARFDRFPWQWESPALAAWQRGQTGIPMVDAGLRELWQTGFMHNRVRMLTASFLVKNLLLDWRLGAQWFWDCLVDADLASNSAGWQWVAGSGADAAPYFRIFNPVTQGRKFDAAGEYVRRYVPELADLPDKYVHCPWEAPAEILAEAGVKLGRDYPTPIVSLKTSRERALEALATLK